MAMAANSSAPTSSPSPAAAASGGGDGGVCSPSSRRPLQSPWAQVVRGVELESSCSGVTATPRSPTSSPPIPTADQVINAEAESSVPEAESNDNANADAAAAAAAAATSKKPVWRKPLNGVVEGTSVMGGAISWPALGESTRPTGKSSPADSSSTSSKPVLDGSTPVSQGPIIAQTPQKPANTNNHANANHGYPRQRSMKNRGASQGGFSRPMPSPPTPPPMPPPFPSNANFVPPPPAPVDSSIRGARPAVNDHNHSTHSQSPRNPRRNNFGGRPRGDGQYQGGRRDHDRRDHLPQFVPPPPPGNYMAPPPPSPGSAPFIPPPPMRPFVPPMGFDMPPPPPYLYMPALPPYMAPPPPPPMYYPMMDPPLQALIIKQIDYYFSDSNLVKDDYLRSNMDNEGWVPLDLIANFPRVQQLTTEIPLIVESLKGSMVVEVKDRGDKLRRRNDWKKWIHTGSSRVSPKSGTVVPGNSPEDVLSSSVNKISLTSSVSGDGNGALDSKDSGLEPARSSTSHDDSSAASSSIVANGDASPEELAANSS